MAGDILLGLSVLPDRSAVDISPKHAPASQIIEGYKPAILFPTLAALIGLVPVLLFVCAWGGRIQKVEEWLPLYAVYVPVGVIFGIGYVRLNRKEAA